MEQPRTHSAETLAARKAYYERIGGDSMTPLWEVLGALVPPRPRSPAVPHHWS
ncbi:gentisate 1,2-dioxygenase [Acidovorax soli]|uniref:Gentisate 1,2-dioxygenase n=1 Tax=Acidovorax soli TaxID=592050 RepID=A0A7X0PDJ5_9BURK|nr:gentisate 1,2-dioxygenase [Acidovorax soli]